MTAALVSAVLFIGQEVMRLVGAPKEVKDLADTLKMLLPFLADAEQRQVKDKDGSVKAWLQQLQEISYDAEDVLDEWNTRILISEIPGDDVLYKGLNCLLSLYPCLKPVLVPYGIALRIKDIRERLDMVAKDKERLNFREGQGHQEEFTRPPTSSLVDESEIYGRDAIKDTIVIQLLSGSSRQDLPVPVISIVGTGGFGKTALAQIILKQEQVVTKFQKTMWWVCVSEPFDRVKVARDIIEQAEGNAPNAAGWETLHKNLCEAVKGKLFLLVLDDIWSYDRKVWEALKLSLDGGAPGSRIIVTARHEDVVARKISYLHHIHRLEQLSDDDCWSLFRHIAFRGRANDAEELEEVGMKIANKCKGVPLVANDVEELEKVGMEIAKKCKGVPLVAKILASLMCFKESPREWRDVLKSDIWEVLSEEGNGFRPELWLSYLPLPSHLKQCFMYCAILKKDVRMKKDELVKLWMAHGFLGFDGTEDLERKGAGYFDNLAMRSFLQNFEKDGEGHIISCKMHDLVHDFAQFLTKCESPIRDTNGQEFCYIRGRHLSAPNLENSSISEQKNLRTLRPLFDRFWYGNMPLGLFHQLACLRVLDLNHAALEEVPVEVDRLLHLRYLDLSETKLKELPETICNLLNLQTLKLNRCFDLLKLPQEIGKLYNLRHLEIGETYRLYSLPQSIGRLRNLRTLSKFIVGGENEECKIEVLKLLDHLQGSLQISGLRHVWEVNNVEELIKQKNNLRSLNLEFSVESDGDRMEIVCKGLEPHSDLEELEIRYYPGPRFPLWLSSLSKVRKLELAGCRECLQLPCLGNLASLEDLTLGGLDSVKHIGCEFYGCDSTSTGNIFPRLRRLVISYMTELERLEFPVSGMPLLSHLIVLNCHRLRALAFKSFPLLSKLVIEWCRNLEELTGVGKLKSLEELKLGHLERVERLGMEFLGISSVSDSDGDSVLIFPKLMRLEFNWMGGLKEWVLPFKKDTKIFPNLVYLKLGYCNRLQSLPALGKLKSLGTLELCELNSVKHLGSEFLGISSDNGSAENGESVPAEVFPHLTHLVLKDMLNWEQEEEIHQIEQDQGGLTKIMPCLHTLEIDRCPELKVVPQYMFSHSLEKLTLNGNVGFLSCSLPISNNYPNLKIFEIKCSPYSSLPEGFNRLTSIQEMIFSDSNDLEFMPDELKHHTMLRQVKISNCPILSEHCRNRENWSTTSSIPKIIIDGGEISFDQ